MHEGQEFILVFFHIIIILARNDLVISYQILMRLTVIDDILVETSPIEPDQVWADYVMFG